jgi:hypothetical protein
MMIQESTCDRDAMILIAKNIWRVCEVETTSSDGFLRGLFILWNPSQVILEDIMENSRFITTSYKEIDSTNSGFITNFYGPNTLQLRKEGNIYRFFMGFSFNI